MLLSQNRQVQTASSEGWRDGVSNMAPFLVGEHSALHLEAPDPLGACERASYFIIAPLLGQR